MQTPSSTLDALIAAYLEEQEAGRAPDREELIGRHPEHAVGLRSFFADYDQMDQRARQLSIDGGPLGGYSTTDYENRSDGLGVVRYVGDYELLHVIKEGGMGVVYKARQKSVSRLVALKMIKTGTLATAQERIRFRNEAEAAAQLDHPNIVPIYEVGEHEGQPYFSMKYVAGGSLDRYVPGLVGQPQTVAALVATLARAVHFAHQRGILHRDLKPGNVLMEETPPNPALRSGAAAGGRSSSPWSPTSGWPSASTPLRRA